jgi:hypothetical protein
MPTTVRLLLVAALMAASAGAAIFVAGAVHNEPPNATPSPSPPITLGEGALIGADPQGTWSAERAATFESEAGTFHLIVRAPVEFVFAETPSGADILVGSVNVASDGVVEFGSTDRCKSAGSYTFAVSDDGDKLTLGTVVDECADRATLLAGDWSREWMEWRLEGGTRYRLPMDRMSVDVTVPQSFVLPSGGFPSYDGPPRPITYGHFRNGSWAFVLNTNSAGAAIDRCHGDAGIRSLPTSIDDYLAWNASSSGLVQGDAVRLTVAGSPAVRVDLTGGPDCQPDTDTAVQPTQMQQGVHVREWAIEVDGRLLLAFIVDEDPFVALTPPVIAAGEAFIDSMEITPSP